MAHFVIVNATTTSVPVIAAGVYDSYLVPSGASGDWSSQAGKIARGNGDEGYEYITLANGDTIFDKASDSFYFYDSTRGKVLSAGVPFELHFSDNGTGITAKETLDHYKGDTSVMPGYAPWDLTVVAASGRAGGGTVTDVDLYLNDGTSDLAGSTVNLSSSGAWTALDETIDVDLDAGDDILAYVDPQGGGDSINRPMYKVFARRRLYG